MATSIVQFREDDVNVQFLRSKGINPNEFGREAFEEALRRLRAMEASVKINEMAERIRKRIGDRPYYDGNVVDLVRHDRDTR